MSNFISRLGSIGLQKESAAGTEAAGTITWFPKFSGQLSEESEKKALEASFGVIDDIADHSIEMEKAKLGAELAVGAITVGHLLLAAFGQENLCVIGTISGMSGGTPARGDAISSVTGSWAGVIRKIITIGGTTYYAISTTSGTISAQTDVTNGTWTGGTLALVTGAYGHYFSRLNSNQHPSFTLYEHTPISDKNALYGMLNTLDLSFTPGDYFKAKVEFMSQKVNSDTGLSPSYNSEGFFKQKNFGIKVGAAETDLNAANLLSVRSMAMTIAKNVSEIEGSRSTTSSKTDPAALVNNQWGASGQFVLTYADDTYRSLFSANTKKAVRQEWINYEETALSGSIYPQMIIDWYKANFTKFSKNDDNNAIVDQTLNIVPEYDRTNGIRADVLLINSQATAY